MLTRYFVNIAFQFESGWNRDDLGTGPPVNYSAYQAPLTIT